MMNFAFKMMNFVFKVATAAGVIAAVAISIKIDEFVLQSINSVF